jgi:hypothetical protein
MCPVQNVTYVSDRSLLGRRIRVGLSRALRAAGLFGFGQK